MSKEYFFKSNENFQFNCWIWKPSMINLSVPKKATAVDWLIVGKAEEGKGYLLAGSTKLFSRDNKDRQWFLSSHSRIIIHPSDPKTLSRILISRKPLRLNNITMCRAVGRSENPQGLEVRSNPRLFSCKSWKVFWWKEGSNTPAGPVTLVPTALNVYIRWMDSKMPAQATIMQCTKP